MEGVPGKTEDGSSPGGSGGRGDVRSGDVRSGDVRSGDGKKGHGEHVHHHHHSSVLPQNTKIRLYSLFKELEKEFENLYLENVHLSNKIADLESGLNNVSSSKSGNQCYHQGGHDEPDIFFEKNPLKSFTKNVTAASKTRYKLKAKTSKIVSSFKTLSSVTANFSKEYKGHRDGLWDVDVSNLGHPLIGTASADKTCKIWGIDSGKCLLTYTGHTGSVNALAFHPSQDLVVTASGDGTAHIWTAAVAPPTNDISTLNNGESEDSESNEDENNGSSTSKKILRNPISILGSHSGVVIGCQWFYEDQVVTASWDRTANLYDVSTGGTLLQTLSGHDGQLNHVACHPSQRLVATCSVDSTFRLWDFREKINSVSVFQGHTESVTCATFSRSEQIVSGSDDRSVKVWDLRNMRAPVISIQTASPVNRLSVSFSGVVAIPHDNRNIVLYDLNASGQKLLRLPRESSKSHHRMVTAACWADHCDWRSRTNLFTAGFDRVGLGWTIKGISRDELSGGLKSKADSKNNPGNSGTF